MSLLLCFVIKDFLKTLDILLQLSNGIELKFKNMLIVLIYSINLSVHFAIKLRQLSCDLLGTVFNQFNNLVGLIFIHILWTHDHDVLLTLKDFLEIKKRFMICN